MLSRFYRFSLSLFGNVIYSIFFCQFFPCQTMLPHFFLLKHLYAAQISLSVWLLGAEPTRHRHRKKKKRRRRRRRRKSRRQGMQVTTRWKNFFTSPTCIVLLLLFIAFLAPEKKKKDGKKEKKRNMSAAAAALAPLATGRLGWSQTKYCSNWFGPTDSYAAGERRGGERRQLSCCNCCCLIPFKSMGGWRERETIVVRSSHQFVPSMYYGMYNTVRT